MKCKKCGAELIASDNFCRICGAKASFSEFDKSNVSTDIAKPKENSLKKVCKKPQLWISIGLFAVLILMIYTTYALSLSSSNNFSVEARPTEISRNEIYDNFKMKSMSYIVPQTWKTTDKEPYRYHYDTDGNMLMVYFTETDSMINDLFFDGFIKGFIESEDTTDIIEQVKEYTYISGKRAFHYVCTCKLNGKDMYMNIYGFIDSEIFYTFSFGSFGDKQSSEFDEAESKIINSLVFDNDYVSEKPTNPPTEKQTEPTTKKPTEPPTEKPTDITEPMTLLYEDNEIAVYYSDIESGYRSDEIDVHLFVENKMNKSITVQSDTVILDGISYNDVICSDPISANTRGMIEISVDGCNNTSPKTVGADLRYFYTDRSGETVRLNIVSHSLK